MKIRGIFSSFQKYFHFGKIYRLRVLGLPQKGARSKPVLYRNFEIVNNMYTIRKPLKFGVSWFLNYRLMGSKAMTKKLQNDHLMGKCLFFGQISLIWSIFAKTYRNILLL